jgi:N-acetylglutamate kinase (EC 2.7.2.8)/N2-acetyl-L-aminoadipate kinase (EC 2.7.2.-)
MSTLVVKIGGAEAVDATAVIADVAAHVAAGTPTVLTHGGSTAVDATLEALGQTPEYVETPAGVTGRFTDAETMEVFTMVMPGQLNTAITVELQAVGVDAVGLSGVDGGLLRGPRKSAVRIVEDGRKRIRRGDHAGRIERVNVPLLRLLLEAGYTPVVSVPMLADDGVAVNADADRAAAAIGAAMDATVVLLTDVAGVYADPDDPTTLIETVQTPDEHAALTDAAEGFMRRKVMAATEALAGGAAAVIIADATREDPLTAALAGAGTHISAAAIEADT